MGGYTTDDLLTAVRQGMMLPDASTGSFSSSALLSYATMELQGPVMTLILEAREKYYMTSYDYDVTANQSFYAIPERAAGGILAQAQYIWGNQINELPAIDPREIYTQQSGVPRAIMFQNNSVVLYPVPTQTTGTLRLYYFQRPSSLEQTINCAQITAISAGSVTCSSVPSTWAAGTQVDWIPSTLPYTPYGLNTVVSGVSGNDVTLTVPTAAQVNAATPTPAPQVGDWLAVSEYTPIPEIPRELFIVLVQATICRVLEAAGDQEKLAQAQAKLSAYAEAAKRQIQPRDQGANKKIVSAWLNY